MFEIKDLSTIDLSNPDEKRYARNVINRRRPEPGLCGCR